MIETNMKAELRDVDLFGDIELYVTNINKNGITEAYYSKEESLKSNDRCFGMQFKDLKFYNIDILDAATYQIDGIFNVQAMNADVAKAAYYKVFKEDTLLTHKYYYFDINVISDGYEILVFDEKDGLEPMHILNFKEFDIVKALNKTYDYVDEIGLVE